MESVGPFHAVYRGAQSLHGRHNSVTVVKGLFTELRLFFRFAQPVFQLVHFFKSLISERGQLHCDCALIARRSLGGQQSLSFGRGCQLSGKAGYSRENIPENHLAHGQRLDIQDLYIILKHDFTAGFCLCLTEHPVCGKESQIFLICKM